MRSKWLASWLGLFLLLLVASTAQAAVGNIEDNVPLLSAKRLQVGLGVQHTWYSGESGGNQEVPTFGKEFEVGAFAAYNIVPNLDLTGSTAYGLDNKVFRSSLGLRVVIFRGIK